jgi:hypothetical protein
VDERRRLGARSFSWTDGLDLEMHDAWGQMGCLCLARHLFLPPGLFLLLPACLVVVNSRFGVVNPVLLGARSLDSIRRHVLSISHLSSPSFIPVHCPGDSTHASSSGLPAPCTYSSLPLPHPILPLSTRQQPARPPLSLFHPTVTSCDTTNHSSLSLLPGLIAYSPVSTVSHSDPSLPTLHSMGITLRDEGSSVL